MTTTPNPYTIGADLCTPFAVTLTININEVTLEQFRADLPRIIAKLESFLVATQAEAAHITGG